MAVFGASRALGWNLETVEGMKAANVIVFAVFHTYDASRTKINRDFNASQFPFAYSDSGFLLYRFTLSTNVFFALVAGFMLARSSYFLASDCFRLVP